MAKEEIILRHIAAKNGVEAQKMTALKNQDHEAEKEVKEMQKTKPKTIIQKGDNLPHHVKNDRMILMNMGKKSLNHRNHRYHHLTLTCKVWRIIAEKSKR